MTERTYLDVEDLDVYRRLCQLHITKDAYESFRARHKECVRMLNGLEKTLERKLPAPDRRWQVAEERSGYGDERELCSPGWPAMEPDT